jgi:hypothetical protein
MNFTWSVQPIWAGVWKSSGKIWSFFDLLRPKKRLWRPFFVIKCSLWLRSN